MIDMDKEIKRLIEKYKYELRCLDPFRSIRWGNDRWKIHGQYDDFEGILLYCIVREFTPSRVLEIGCGCGYSTLHILSALKRNQRGICISYDISDFVASIAREIIKSMDLDVYSNIISKDITKENLESIGKYDLFFIDMNGHRYYDGDWWTNNLISLLNKNNVLVHDILNLGDGPESFEEWKPVKEFILKNKWDYTLLHRIFNSMKRENKLEGMQKYFNPSTPGWKDETNPTLWMWKDMTW